MQGPAHLVLSWFVGEAAGLKTPKGRRIVALSGLAPDIDAVAYPAAYFYFGFDLDRAYSDVWQVVHHRYTHGVGFVLLTGIIAWWIAGRRPAKRADSVSALTAAQDSATKVAALAMLTSMLHVSFDLIAAGPGWPVYPLWPLMDTAWGMPWSWNVSDWPNITITIGCLVAMLIYAKVAGYSVAESISYRLDNWMTRIIQTGSDAGGVATESSRRARTLRIVIFASLILVTIAIVTPLLLQA